MQNAGLNNTPVYIWRCICCVYVSCSSLYRATHADMQQQARFCSALLYNTDSNRK